MLIDQAIFSSARTPRADGYQIVAASGGVTEDESRELAIWGPSHGSLCPRNGNQTSVNFHRLQSGRFCLSKTTAAGEEYSGRGRRIDTHFFLVPEEVLARFANNPFAVLRAVWAKGLIHAYNGSPGTKLEGFSLVGRGSTVDEGLLAQWADRSGPRQVARTIVAAQMPTPTLLAGIENMETLIGGVLNALPVECRPEVSFTTGLLFSPRRPYRLGPTAAESADPRLNHRMAGVATVDFAQESPPAEALRGWPAYVAELLTADQLSILATQLQQARPGLRMEKLDALGEQLLSEFRRTYTTAAMAPSPRKPDTIVPNLKRANLMSRDREPSSAADVRRSGAQFRLSAPAKEPIFAPDSDPHSAELLQQLDDAVFDAVNSEPGAVERVQQLWDRLGEQLGPDARRAAREQYLRYTLTLWDSCLDEGLRDPQQAVAALDVLSVLFDAE